jgi:hypothetical protein
MNRWLLTFLKSNGMLKTIGQTPGSRLSVIMLIMLFLSCFISTTSPSWRYAQSTLIWCVDNNLSGNILYICLWRQWFKCPKSCTGVLSIFLMSTTVRIWRSALFDCRNIYNTSHLLYFFIFYFYFWRSLLFMLPYAHNIWIFNIDIDSFLLRLGWL